jgi:hypothetical protein
MPIAGYEGLYEVSDLGCVRSLRHAPAMLLSPWADGDGYLRIGLWDGERQKKHALHRLVAIAFHGEKRNALHCEAAHLDGNPANARADNLKWVSKVENRSHRKLHGTHNAGAGAWNAKLTDAAVRHIRSVREGRSSLAAQYGVTPWAIDDVRRGRNWKHVA